MFSSSSPFSIFFFCLPSLPTFHFLDFQSFPSKSMWIALHGYVIFFRNMFHLYPTLNHPSIICTRHFIVNSVIQKGVIDPPVLNQRISINIFSKLIKYMFSNICCYQCHQFQYDGSTVWICFSITVQFAACWGISFSIAGVCFIESSVSFS